MDGLVVRCHGSFLHGLAHGWVAVADAGNVLRACAVLHGKHALWDKLAGIGRHDVHAQDLVGLFVCDHLDDASSVIYAAGAAIGHHGELARLVLHALRLELLLCLANPSNLGPGVDDGGHGAVVDVAILAGNDLNSSDAVLLRLMSQHGSLNDITNGVHAGHAGAEVVIHRDCAALVEGDAELLQAKAGCEGASACCHQHRVGLQHLGVATLHGLHRHLDLAV
mmetsp:Transcript_30938/g.78151  ORF Transcript_30938/g.78151 Transcript_30938/m.78151 type:complete len:223 (-) Transcript_30938:938-1606(-)